MGFRTSLLLSVIVVQAALLVAVLAGLVKFSTGVGAAESVLVGGQAFLASAVLLLTALAFLRNIK